MANSLEVRAPFLNHEVVQFGLNLPISKRMGFRQNKPLLRAIARHLLPNVEWNRPKKGFAIPRAEWIRGEYRDLISSILLDSTTLNRGWYSRKRVSDLLLRHNRGEKLDSTIWPLFTLEIWARNWLDG